MKDYSNIKILYIGPLNFGGTCLYRMKALLCLGIKIDFVNTDRTQNGNYCIDFIIRFFTKFLGKLWAGLVNIKVFLKINRNNYDYLWIDKGTLIQLKILEFAKRKNPKVKIISYSPDDMLNPGNQSRHYLESLSIYDLNVTTKTFNVNELIGLGAKNVIFLNNSYSPFVHKPHVGLENRDLFAQTISVGFVGTYEQQRAESLDFLARNGINITVHGVGWKKLRREKITLVHKNILGDDYAGILSSTAINLCFLRKVNRDLQTTRSIEIPACGGFMLAERTIEHLQLFKEGIEAEFFDGNEELLSKVKFYLNHENARLKIARAGLQRCLSSGYSDVDTVKKILAAARIS